MSEQEIDAQIAQIDDVIGQLIAAAQSGAASATIRKYRVDSGQSVVETERYAASSIPGAIVQWKRLRSDLINQKQGRVLRALPSASGA